MLTRRGAANAALAIILLIALGLRLHNVGFGLPSMYDPDEPIFMVKALELLKNETLNPKWFGHPGTTTIYLVAIIDVAVLLGGFVTGMWHSIGEFAKAVFADPSLLFIPARVAMAILGVLSIWLTFCLGRRIHGTSAGLIAAALLALNAVHLAWSQVVRTDIHASVFMLACLLFTVSVARNGKKKDYVLAGLFAGFAVATKWPAVTIFISVIGVFASRALAGRDGIKRELAGLIMSGIALILGLFLASPYIFLDWPTVLSNLSNEARPHHLGHTGHGFLANAWWYLWNPVRESVGVVGLLLIAAGLALSAIRSRTSRWTLIPAAICFFVMISAQHLVWSRWILPLIPMLTIFAAVAIVGVAETATAILRSRRRELILVSVAALAAAPSVAGAFNEIIERGNDTRTQAANWAIQHIPRGRSVVLEHLELSLRKRPWTILFPIGDAGCVDAKQILAQGVDYQEVEHLRNGSPIVDLGNVAPSRLESCRADYAILTYYDLYRAESANYPRELGNYKKLLAGGRTVALFEPRPGHAGGPIVRIVAFGPH